MTDSQGIPMPEEKQLRSHVYHVEIPVDIPKLFVLYTVSFQFPTGIYHVGEAIDVELRIDSVEHDQSCKSVAVNRDCIYEIDADDLSWIVTGMRRGSFRTVDMVRQRLTLIPLHTGKIMYPSITIHGSDEETSQAEIHLLTAEMFVIISAKDSATEIIL